jgi:hypothetical protein
VRSAQQQDDSAARAAMDATSYAVKKTEPEPNEEQKASNK